MEREIRTSCYWQIKEYHLDNPTAFDGGPHIDGPAYADGTGCAEHYMGNFRYDDETLSITVDIEVGFDIPDHTRALTTIEMFRFMIQNVIGR